MKYLKMLIHKKKRAKNFILHFLCLKISSFFFFFQVSDRTNWKDEPDRRDVSRSWRFWSTSSWRIEALASKPTQLRILAVAAYGLLSPPPSSSCILIHLSIYLSLFRASGARQGALHVDLCSAQSSPIFETKSRGSWRQSLLPTCGCSYNVIEFLRGFFSQIKTKKRRNGGKKRLGCCSGGGAGNGVGPIRVNTIISLGPL